MGGDTAAGLGFGKQENRVHGAAGLECAGLLEILAFEEDLSAGKFV
jgi:hypothetical protein